MELRPALAPTRRMVVMMTGPMRTSGAASTRSSLASQRPLDHRTLFENRSSDDGQHTLVEADFFVSGAFGLILKLSTSPSKTNHPGFVSWKEALSMHNTTGSQRGTLERIKEMCRKDHQARSKELKRARKRSKVHGKSCRAL